MHPIIAKLDQLSETKAAAEVTRLDYEAKRAEIMKAVQAQLDDLAAEFEPLINSAEERAADLEAEIRSRRVPQAGPAEREFASCKIITKLSA